MTGLGLGLGFFGTVSARVLQENSHELVLPIQILEIEMDTNAGAIVHALATPWRAIFEQIKNDPDLLFDFSKSHRKFEEFIASSYEKAGYDIVILTPASGDLGRDVIARKTGVGTVKVLDQCKAFSKGNLVTANDVRAIMGSLYREGDANMAVVSTTSDFAPRVWDEWEDHIGKELELRNGEKLIKWLNEIA